MTRAPPIRHPDVSVKERPSVGVGEAGHWIVAPEIVVIANIFL